MYAFKNKNLKKKLILFYYIISCGYETTSNKKYTGTNNIGQNRYVCQLNLSFFMWF